MRPLLALALAAWLASPPLSAQEDALDAEIRAAFERRLEEEASQLAGEFGRELARRTREVEPLAGMPEARRRAAMRLVRQLERLPAGELARTVVSTRQPRIASVADLAVELGNRRVVLVGEQHDDPVHHELQARVLALVHAVDRRVALGMEMFQRPAQPILDDFIAWRITEAEFLERVNWRESWGFDWALYRPLLLFARDHGLPVVALNAPRDVVRKVSRGGLASLAPPDRARIAAEVDTKVASHRRRYEGMMGGHGAHGDPEHMYEAMCVWDDTMAESAARFLAANPGWRILVVAGNGHVEHRDGIADRIEKRVASGHFTVVPRTLSPGERVDFEALVADPPGDLVVFTTR